MYKNQFFSLSSSLALQLCSSIQLYLALSSSIQLYLAISSSISLPLYLPTGLSHCVDFSGILFQIFRHFYIFLGQFDHFRVILLNFRLYYFRSLDIFKRNIFTQNFILVVILNILSFQFLIFFSRLSENIKKMFFLMSI